MVSIITGLIESGFNDIIVVNDGSASEHLAPFDVVSKFPECTVLNHPSNKGKGAALKTALSFFLEFRPEKAGVIMMDADGQHRPADAAACARELIKSEDAVVLGVRDFLHPDVPKRNSFGNRLTAFVFRVIFGIKIKDTQTGLRGVPTSHIPLMLEVPGKRFDYETNMLIEIEQVGIPFNEVSIQTVYEEGSNERSHFRPFVDTLMISLRLLKYAMSSLISSVVDVGIFWFALHSLGAALGLWSIPVCTAIARLFSSFLNFNINKRFVFKRKKMFRSLIWRYYTVAVTQMLTSALLLWILAQLVDGTHAAGLMTLLKAAVDTILFFISYHIQRSWVFKHNYGASSL